MTLLSRLFGQKGEPVKRVRICVECGMPLDGHKDWCSILRAKQAMRPKDRQPAAQADSPASI